MLARQDIEYFNHRDPERFLKLREKIFTPRLKTLRHWGKALCLKAKDDLSIVVFGAKETVEASKLGLEVVDLFGSQGERISCNGLKPRQWCMTGLFL